MTRDGLMILSPGLPAFVVVLNFMPFGGVRLHPQAL